LTVALQNPSLLASFSTKANYKKNVPPMIQEDLSQMTNEQLMDPSTIPGWDLIHSPPGKMPRGALVGTVVSTKMQKTVNVAVDRYRIVPKIRKRVKYTRKFMAHDETEVANMGDIVMIEPSHKISKRKHFMLSKIVRPKGQLGY
jgi:small subunit ribosomal protein S17